MHKCRHHSSYSKRCARIARIISWAFSTLPVYQEEGWISFPLVYLVLGAFRKRSERLETETALEVVSFQRYRVQLLAGTSAVGT